MKARFPLYTKILLWFFLNLLVLALAGAIVFFAQFGGGSEWLVAGPAGDRLQAMARVIRDELHMRPRGEWDQILQRFSTAYSVEVFLFRNEGAQVAGARVTLPRLVFERLVERRPTMRPRPPDSPPFRRGEEPPDGPGDFPPRGDRLPPRIDAAPPIRFVVHTETPNRYWIGLAMPVIDQRNERAAGTLLIAMNSVRAGGLLLDVRLWLWLGAGAVVFSLLFWLPLVTGITRSISQMQTATIQIAEGKFDVRVNERRRDELGTLGAAINRMASRLAGFVAGQKRFTGDVAHELCSPIARMQMALGILEERAGEKEKRYVEDVREELQHMSSLVNELLSFSKASLGAANTKLESIVLRPLIEKAVRREMRDGANIQLDIPDELRAIVDPELFVRAVSNLLRNAVHYAAEAGPILVSGMELDSEVELVVGDSGPGVPESELPKLFDPFYRVDASRTRETGGVGLGLSIVKTCVEACHGTVLCRNRAPGGFEVVMRLPH